MYMADGVNKDIDLLGNSTSRYHGLVYAPDGEIEVGGAGNKMPPVNTQLVGWNVIVHGDAESDINFEESLVFQVPPSLDLTR